MPAALPRPRKIALSTLQHCRSLASTTQGEKGDGNRYFRDGKPVYHFVSLPVKISNLSDHIVVAFCYGKNAIIA